MTSRESREEAIEMVLNGLQTMILVASRRAAGEQYSPQADADHSDDVIRWRKEEMVKLRRIRKEFEDLSTGILADEASAWVLEVVSIKKQVVEQCGELIEAKFSGVEFTIRRL